MLVLVLCLGINTAELSTDIMCFFLIWLAEAVISLLWAPDKVLALKYVYYICLINSLCVLLHCFLRRENVLMFCQLMVVVLLLCNLIAFWEVRTGNHLVKSYLSTPERLRLLKYVPCCFWYNPNDFATFIVQIIPFSFVCISSPKRVFRVFSLFNVVVSFFVVCATQSRTQIILLLILYVFFAVIFLKKDFIKLAVGALAAVILLYSIYPEFQKLMDDALDSISGKSLVSTVVSEGGSMRIRINLLKNAGYMLLDTVGFGVGAGCHRVVMAEYSSLYFNTHNILVMHNLLGELFADYGLFIGVMFLGAIVSSCRKLFHIYQTAKEEHTRMLSLMLCCSLGMFILCCMASSSVLQLTSLWMTFCFTSAFIKLHKAN